MAARKDDTTKLPMHLIPWDAIDGVARVLDFGAKKYGDRNWESGEISIDRFLSAAIRHISQHFQGNITDQESGLRHLDHAACSILMAVALRCRGF